jgi:hypothetical protein
VRLRAGGRSLRVWMDERFACVLVCTGDGLPRGASSSRRCAGRRVPRM